MRDGLVVLVLFGLASCVPVAEEVGRVTESPSPTSTATLTRTATATFTSTATSTPTKTPRPRDTATETPAATPATVPAVVTRIIDGDTIEVRIGGETFRVRYIGMNTPETDEFCGPEATEVNRSLVGGQTVRLVKDVSETDRFGRLLRYVYVGDLFVNAELVRRGYASAATFPPDVTFASLFSQLESEARQAGRGCWAPTEPPPPQGSNCHPSYEGVCLPVGIGDFDCTRAGGGNGPNYVEDYTGSPVRVVGLDEFRLDRDNDGLGCE